MNLFYLSIISFLLLISCATIKPEVPELVIKDTPELEQVKSTILVPLKINLATYFNEVDKFILSRSFCFCSRVH